MALRILQFCALFAIGYSKGPDSSFGKAFQAPDIDLSINLTDPGDVIVKKGQSAIFRCDVFSTIEDLQVTWFHKNETISSNDSRWIIRDDHSLFIPKVAAGKRFNRVTGEYQCLARNRAGALLSNVAKLKVASLEKDFSKEPSDLTVPESQPAVLYCNIRSTPPADIQWEYNNQPLPQNTRYVPLPNGVLLISNSHSEDSGYYKCKATNNILNKVKNSVEAYLKVTPRPTREEQPSFLPLDFPQNSSVLAGEAINVYCSAKGWPLPKVQWLNNDGVIVSNSSHLYLTNVNIHHSGTYTCLARNKNGIAKLEHLILVYQIPHFTTRPHSKAYPMAITVRLECNATGTPQPKLQWLKDGKPLVLDGVSMKQQSSGALVFRHTFSKDSGIYQCIAINSVGRSWTAARIEINVSHIPNPPENLRCRPYNANSVCLSWQAPANVTIQAYSIHSQYGVDGATLPGPDYVSEDTYYHAMGLNTSTNYTFYVRVYSNVASDPSEKVTCRTDNVQNRNIDIEFIELDTVTLKWSEISTDRSCDGHKDSYRVQWREEGHFPVNNERTEKQTFTITALVPGVDYEFRVTSSNPKDQETAPWVLYTVPDRNFTKYEFTETNHTLPLPPKQLDGQTLSTTSIKLTWTINEKNYKFFTICYVNVADGKKCETGTLVKTFSNKFILTKLQPNTLYKFKVRTHSQDGTPGRYSHSIQARTSVDVPSPVQDLKYKVLNDTTACLIWQAPQLQNGAKLINYIVSYTPDRNWPLDKWIDMTVPINSAESVARCLPPNNKDYITAILSNLSSGAQYLVLVRAVSHIGIGKPILPIVVTTKVLVEVPKPDLQNEIKYHKKVGIIIGTIASLICIICCIACILVRRRCLKRRAIARARSTAASNNYYPASARYASRVGRVQVRLPQPCLTVGDERENDSLVITDTHPNTNVIPVTASMFNTKVCDYANGHLNGSPKSTLNGHLPSSVHITENPQFYAYESNGQNDEKKPKPITTLSLSFEEDTNSNVKSSKFYDLYRLFENSKKNKSSSYDRHHHQCDPHFEDRVQKIHHSSRDSEEFSPDTTQLTCLDDSLNEMGNRRVSPILGPNG